MRRSLQNVNSGLSHPCCPFVVLVVCAQDLLSDDFRFSFQFHSILLYIAQFTTNVIS